MTHPSHPAAVAAAQHAAHRIFVSDPKCSYMMPPEVERVTNIILDAITAALSAPSPVGESLISQVRGLEMETERLERELAAANMRIAQYEQTDEITDVELSLLDESSQRFVAWRRKLGVRIRQPFAKCAWDEQERVITALREQVRALEEDKARCTNSVVEAMIAFPNVKEYISALEENASDMDWWVSIGCPKIYPMRPADDDPDQRPMWFLPDHSSVHHSRDPLSAIRAARLANAKADEKQCFCTNGIVRSLGRDNDEIISDCPVCAARPASGGEEAK